MKDFAPPVNTKSLLKPNSLKTRLRGRHKATLAAVALLSSVTFGSEVLNHDSCVIQSPPEKIASVEVIDNKDSLPGVTKYFNLADIESMVPTTKRTTLTETSESFKFKKQVIPKGVLLDQYYQLRNVIETSKAYPLGYVESTFNINVPENVLKDILIKYALSIAIVESTCGLNAHQKQTDLDRPQGLFQIKPSIAKNLIKTYKIKESEITAQLDLDSKVSDQVRERYKAHLSEMYDNTLTAWSSNMLIRELLSSSDRFNSFMALLNMRNAYEVVSRRQHRKYTKPYLKIFTDSKTPFWVRLVMYHHSGKNVNDIKNYSIKVSSVFVSLSHSDAI